MTKLLPTLIPLVSTLIVAVSGTVQADLAKFVGAHTVFASVLTLVGLVVNHWLPSPATT